MLKLQNQIIIISIFVSFSKKSTIFARQSNKYKTLTTFMKHRILLFSALMLVLPIKAQRYVGGDISNLTSNKACNPTYYDFDGNVTEPLELFKQQQLNAMRVRLHVKPSDYPNNDKNACQDLEYVKKLGKEIKDAGFKLMLDFHYSDTWADPKKQWTPKQWENLSDTELYTKIYEYTKDALQQMKDAGAEPEFIQTGNEISYGMLWGKEGSSNLKQCYMGNGYVEANWNRFTTLLSKAVKACREVCPEAKVILHTERVAAPSVMTFFYDKMKSANVDYDIIGLSYYPIWHNKISTLEDALKQLEVKYPEKQIMIVETGASYKWLDDKRDYTPSYSLDEAGQKQFTDELITMLNKHEKVVGLFWWWMDYNPYPYSTTNMDNWWYAPLYNGDTGKPLAAMKSLKNFLQGTSSVNGVETEASEDAGVWYNAAGQPSGNNPQKPGIYFKKGKKLVVVKK